MPHLPVFPLRLNWWLESTPTSLLEVENLLQLGYPSLMLYKLFVKVCYLFLDLVLKYIPFVQNKSPGIEKDIGEVWTPVNMYSKNFCFSVWTKNSPYCSLSWVAADFSSTWFELTFLLQVFSINICSRAVSFLHAVSSIIPNSFIDADPCEVINICCISCFSIGYI